MVINDILAEAIIKKGQFLGRSGRWEEAASEFKKIAELPGVRNARASYLYGNALFNLKKYSESLTWTANAINLDARNPRWFVRLGALYEKLKRHEEASSAYNNAVILDPSNVEWLTRLARAQTNSNQLNEAKNTLSNAIRIAPENKEVTSAYVTAALKSSPVWQKVEALEHALKTDPSNTEWLEILGREYRSLSQFTASVKTHHKAILAGSKSLTNAFGMAISARDANRHDLESDALEFIRSNDPNEQNPLTSAGRICQQKGDWPNAFSYYKRALASTSGNANLYYDAGLAADRSHRWTEASLLMREAVEENPDKSNWHFRLGLTLERQGKIPEAIEAYEAAIRFSTKPQTYWHFRLGFCYALDNQPKMASEAFFYSMSGQDELVESVVSCNNQQPTKYDEDLLMANLKRLTRRGDHGSLHTRGLQLLRKGYLNLALEFLTEACLRNPEQTPTWYFHKALAEYALGRHDSAADTFLNTRVFRNPDGISSDHYLKVKWRRDLMEYVEYQNYLKINSSAILFESYFGNQISCNPLALWNEITSNPKWDHLTHYWVTSKNTIIPDAIRNHEKTVIVERGSRLYFRTLASAKYLVNNVTFPHYFTRRKEQVYLNTWHGTPLKTLGKDIQTGFMEHANVSRNFLQATHLLAANTHTENILIDRYDIRGLFAGSIIRSGSPRIDEIINMKSEKVLELREQLGIPESSKVVFYAPTWRGSLNTKHFDTESLLNDLETMSSLDGCVVLFRAHHMTEKMLEGLKINAVTVPSNISSNEILSITDVLVTDYSSIFFDYLPLNRPIVYHVPDLNEYTTERGLYFEIDTMPGYVSKSTAELKNCLELALTAGVANIEEHKRAVELFCPREDGTASRIVSECLLGLRETELVDPKKDDRLTLLFHQSLLPNGITSAFLNLVNAIDPSKYRIVFLFDPAPLLADPLRMEKFTLLPENVQKIARVGSQLVSLEERWVIDKFNAWNNWASDEQESIYRAGFEREFRRIFGKAEFDAIIEFDGYASFWSALMASASTRGKSVAYMHNRLYKEWTTKYPELAATMRVNRWYDALLSVSEATNEINRQELGSIFGIDNEKFIHTDNLIDASSIELQSLEKLDSDLEDFVAGSPEVWMTIGRMSPEKAHLKLFRAFRDHLTTSPKAKLVLLGDGPLKLELESFVNSNSLGSSILLAGQRSNPFPMMRRADAFVLASDHEGQPMVLLEALALKKTVMATDIVGNRGVLGPGYGLLVENNIAGLVSGFKLAFSVKPENSFDVEKYCSKALEETLRVFSPRQ